MWPFSGCDVDACAASDPNAITTSTLLSLLPFLAVFATAHSIAVRHIYPRLSQGGDAQDGEDHVLPEHAPAALRQVHAEHGAKSLQRRLVAWTFGTTVGLAATLGTLILAEILEVGSARARALALGVAVPGLLLLIVVVVPWLECRSLVRAAGWSFQRSARGKAAGAAWGMQTVLFGSWLFVFWALGGAIPSTSARTNSSRQSGTGESSSSQSQQRELALHDGLGEMLTRACLERVGVVGICLMALLAGFASVSTPWHTFSDVTTRRKRPVTEADVNRKQSGLDATNEMLLTKQHRLQMLERKVSEGSGGATKSGFMGKMMGSIRGASGDELEMKALRMEISGLETMQANLSSNLALVKDHRDAAARASTAAGRLLLVPSYVFSCYCVYRILATAFATSRRALSPSSSSFSSSDPINRFLGLLARHWNPNIDQMAWARIISFGLSGLMLLLSANSVVQTLHLFSRWTPSFLARHARSSLAPAAGQVAATYVVSSALLLRSHLPGNVSSAVGGALMMRGAGPSISSTGGVGGGVPLMLSPAFADGWFEGWFLVGAFVTGLGIWVGRSVAGGWEGELFGDEYGMEEMGTKRS